MFSEWPTIEPDKDTELLLEAEENLIEFLRSLYIKGVRDPLKDVGTRGAALISRN